MNIQVGGKNMDNGASSYRRYLSGDENAFDEIMENYFDSLIFFIDRYVHDTSAAEDIAIDTFTYMITNPHKYDFRVTLKTYLFMIGKSRALNYLKHRAKFQTADILISENDISERITLEESVIKNEQNRLLNKAVEQLSDDMKIAVHLVYFEELSYEEAAKVMKKNKKQVDNLLYRAKNTLRTILEKEGTVLL
ncbi:MAG: RNA polymerase sigma factor [Ruminococcaceae bacterium]|nr:RNA polymerase sigma factor [Oscillospiraceae bacterium]